MAESPQKRSSCSCGRTMHFNSSAPSCWLALTTLHSSRSTSHGALLAPPRSKARTESALRHPIRTLFITKQLDRLREAGNWLSRAEASALRVSRESGRGTLASSFSFSLPSGRFSLVFLQAGLRRAYGPRGERLLHLRGPHAPERVLFVRLHLLQVSAWCMRVCWSVACGASRVRFGWFQ